MPNRYVREDILDSERVDALSADAEVFYRRLMSKADDYGRFHGDWRKLRAALYPLRVEKITEKYVERLLVECSQVIEGRPLLRIYFSEGRRYLEITNFKQQIRSESKFPNSSNGTISIDSSSYQVIADDNTCLQVRSDTDSISSSSSNSNSEEGGSAEGGGRAPLVEESIQRNAERIYRNHPPGRRDIGRGQVATKLRAILRRKELGGPPGLVYLDELAARHERCCRSHDWTKEGGEYAKGLNNWLAPTIERYEQEPAPQGQARASPETNRDRYLRELEEVNLEEGNAHQ